MAFVSDLRFWIFSSSTQSRIRTSCAPSSQADVFAASDFHRLTDSLSTQYRLVIASVLQLKVIQAGMHVSECLTVANALAGTLDFGPT